MRCSQFVLVPDELQNVTQAADAKLFQTSFDLLYGSSPWPPAAVRGLGGQFAERRRRPLQRILGSPGQRHRQQRPGPVTDLRRESLALETAFSDLTALAEGSPQGPDTLAKYQELYGEWKTKLAALDQGPRHRR